MKLTEDMRRVVGELRLGFVATVCPDGRPNLSPKGTTLVWDDGHLMFADIVSPTTVANLVSNPNVEVNVVDPIVRKGYRFRGAATVHRGDVSYERGLELLAEAGSTLAQERVRAIVVIDVADAAAVVSPAYDAGATEGDVADRWWRHHAALHGARRDHADGGAEAVVLTGVYGVGKSTIAEDIAAILEGAEIPNAALDLDWLTWTNASGPTRADEHAMMLTNLAVVAGNYRMAGATHFVLARSIQDSEELAGVRAALGVPLRIVEIIVPYEVIARRLASAPTNQRRDDLATSAAWLADRTGAGLADLTVTNEGLVGDVSSEILRWLGWIPST